MKLTNKQLASKQEKTVELDDLKFQEPIDETNTNTNDVSKFTKINIPEKGSYTSKT